MLKTFLKINIFLCILFSLLGEGLFSIASAQSDTSNTTQNTTNSSKSNDGSGVQYILLEPIKDPKTNSTTTSLSLNKDSISEYLNLILQYIFLLIAITAAFYLIYGGIQYLTTDIIHLKMEGKETITRVLIGLVFVFSVWSIFNLLNPNLLKLDFNFGEPYREAENEGDIKPGTPTGVKNTLECPTGIVSVYGIEVCKSIENNLKNLIDAAKKDGYNLTGTGFRTSESQIKKRIANCKCSETDIQCIFGKPSRECTPETAIPGTSNHERGLAIDFGCAGYSKFGSSPCFTWMKNNASKYSFFNLKSEPWHWSPNGK